MAGVSVSIPPPQSRGLSGTSRIPAISREFGKSIDRLLNEGEEKMTAKSNSFMMVK